jgi:TonB family protein
MTFSTKGSLLLVMLLLFSCGPGRDSQTTENEKPTTPALHPTKSPAGKLGDILPATRTEGKPAGRQTEPARTPAPPPPKPAVSPVGADSWKLPQPGKGGEDLYAWYKQLDQPAQTFNLPAGKDTTLTCREGTTIRVTAYSFVDPKNGKAANRTIQLRIKEYYSTASMLLANLSTMHKTDMLETGGMVYLEAVAGESTLSLRPGGVVQVGFPYAEREEGMQLFNGIWHAARLDWEPAGENSWEAEAAPGGLATVAPLDREPGFSGGEEAWRNYFRKSLRYPRGAARRNVSGNVEVGFVVSENGRIEEVQVLKGIDAELDREAVRFISGMPAWQPGVRAGKTVRVRRAMPIRFVLDGVSAEYNTNDSTYARQFEETVTNENLFQTNIVKVSRYLFSTSRLGWINCDRFYGSKKTRGSYAIAAGSAPQLDIKIVFHDLRSILAGERRKGRYYFGRLPVGERVTLVALKRENDACYLAVRQTRIREGVDPELVFKPVTVAELKAEMTKLNWK